MNKWVPKVALLIFMMALLVGVLQSSVYATTSENVSQEKTQIKYSGKDGSLSWSIDVAGHLLVTGSGNYTGTYQSIKIANAGFSGKYPNWIAYKDEIIAAKLDVSNIKNASCLLIGCNNLTTVDLSAFDMSKATDISCMFTGCEKLKEVNFGLSSPEQITDMGFLLFVCLFLF